MSTTATRTTAPPAAPPNNGRVDMSHRQILEALSGLLLGLFVAILSSTVVSNALPTIIGNLGGGQAAYTWVVTASLLATTATTPIWGKLSDLFSKKLLVQLSLVVFVLGSAIAGLSQSSGMLIGARVIQGLGVGGLTALTQVCLAMMIPPRERGRYSGYMGAVFAVGTVAGPLVGGVIVDTSWLGWRWCFYVGVPFAVIAILVLQKTLHLPTFRRDDVRIDWLGAFLIMASVSLLLIWVTLAGHNYDWISWQSFVMVPGAILLGVLAVLVESRAKEPILPPWLFQSRTIVLAIVGSLFVGIAMFGATVYLSQYFQLSRGDSPTQSGISTMPLILGLFVSSLVSGRIITRTGRWKRWLVSGTVVMTIGFGLMGMLRSDTPYWWIALFMALIGIGVGMTMQNLVLSVQNVVPVNQLGVASAGVAFFRSLGGAVGVSVLGAVLANRVNAHIREGLTAIGVPVPASTGTEIPDLSTLPAPVAAVIERSYGIGFGDIFLIAAPLALLAVLAVLFIKEIPLRTSNALPGQAAGQGTEQLVEATEAGALAGGVGTEPVVADLADPDRQAQSSATARTRTVPAGAVSAALPSDGNGRLDGTLHRAVDSSVNGSANGAVNGSTNGAVNGSTNGAINGATNGAVGIPSATGATAHPLSNAGTISGTVTGSGGALAGTALTLMDDGGREVARTRTEPDGSFRVPVPTGGSYLLVATAAGHRPVAASVTVADGEVRRDLALVAACTVRGVVRDDEGRPRAGATVTVTDARGEVVASVVTGPAGQFAMTDLYAGAYIVTAFAGGSIPEARRVTLSDAGEVDADLTLIRTGTLTGTVSARSSDRPVAEAAVTVLDSTGAILESTVTGPDGGYEFAGLVPGDYTLVASGYAPVATAVRLAGGDLERHDLELSHDDDAGTLRHGRHALPESAPSAPSVPSELR
ncbi:MFS transporter [Nakamurella endophytica]|uniref:MFS transporter n=1 Tax=Nakamurella endophytica TaxID=1748367 RepID=A0A917SXB3_9ACTN|nr:MFS transporter [Nakamurella endophytica]GGM00897.1 MFS transporter [Nakamurella endophytica]